MKGRWVTQNWTLKLFSLVVSMLLFLFVSVERSAAVEVEFPINYATPPGLMLLLDAPQRLQATLEGPWASFYSFDDLDPVLIDLTKEEPGTVSYVVKPTDLHVPAGMRPVSIRPTELSLTLDRRVEKLVPVEVDPLGRPAFGFEIVEMRAEPARVKVEGPMSSMRTVDFVQTRPVSLRDRQQDLSVEVDLRPPSLPIRLADRRTVMVHVHIGEEELQRNLELPVTLANAPVGTRVVPDRVLVTLKGPRQFVDSLDQRTLTAVVDVGEEAQAGVRSVVKPVSLIPPLPERTQVMGSIPDVQITLPKMRKR